MEVDLLGADARVALEIDGAQHLSDPVAYRRDRRRDQRLQQNGYLVLRFLAEDLGRELDLVLDTILRALVGAAAGRSKWTPHRRRGAFGLRATSVSRCWNGGAEGDQTPDLMNAIPVASVPYRPVRCTRGERRTGRRGPQLLKAGGSTPPVSCASLGSSAYTWSHEDGTGDL
jgi:uncharacterized protein DUF559